MILLVAGLVVAVVVGLAAGVLMGSVTRSRVVGVLVWLVVAPSVAFVPFAVAVSDSPSAAPTFSQAQLEADRVMTQQMATVVGPGMDAQMASNGMLERSANGAYLSALQEHITRFDQMTGLSP